ncbi:hypothetical protein KBB96_16005 [Luteolibacter ambystomatis]|uniref:Piwi domain-containing protein n=1 Tax=Luteolibacter ambystomatis TaxID=2824561 RepID=A0A975G7V3_9BACT|nr:hypothetical protein [Luteolibacter ambystomatis]QUE50360.1 hypothetical protein KBB96_16005 [Luteolibacter ambystomatis]
MTPKISVIHEPMLEFAKGGTSRDIRRGILKWGPIDAGTNRTKSEIRLGLVGTPKTIASFMEWFEECRTGVVASDLLNENLNPPFPGLSLDVGLRCEFLTDRTWTEEISESEIRKALDGSGRVISTAEAFHDRIKSLHELSASKPDVVICLPPENVRRQLKPSLGGDDDEDWEDFDEQKGPDFHDYLKGLCLETGSVFQLIWPRTYTKGTKGVQDMATCAWNLFTALFYKSGGVPWKLQRAPGSLSTCYIGIAFSKREGTGFSHSSLTQIFNDRGEGTILRGGLASRSDDDHEVHLAEKDAFLLLEDAIKNYAGANRGSIPQRVVLHKTSSFDLAEKKGFNDACDAAGIRFLDLLAVNASPLRLFRSGTYPPLRGTHAIFDDANSILYTRGSIPFYRKYPGPYVPKSLHIRYYQTDRPQEDLAAEILALTKLNWNRTQFDSFDPITIGGSKRIGDIYRWCLNAPTRPISYSFFM